MKNKSKWLQFFFCIVSRCTGCERMRAREAKSDIQCIKCNKSSEANQPSFSMNLSPTLCQIVKADVLRTGKNQSEFPFPTTETKCRDWGFDLGRFQTELHKTFHPKPQRNSSKSGIQFSWHKERRSIVIWKKSRLYRRAKWHFKYLWFILPCLPVFLQNSKITNPVVMFNTQKPSLFPL